MLANTEMSPLLPIYSFTSSTLVRALFMSSEHTLLILCGREYNQLEMF